MVETEKSRALKSPNPSGGDLPENAARERNDTAPLAESESTPAVHAPFFVVGILPTAISLSL
jgi:hypothetical protein